MFPVIHCVFVYTIFSQLQIGYGRFFQEFRQGNLNFNYKQISKFCRDNKPRMSYNLAVTMLINNLHNVQKLDANLKIFECQKFQFQNS